MIGVHLPYILIIGRSWMEMHEGGLKRLNLHGNGVANAQWITLTSRISVDEGLRRQCDAEKYALIINHS